MRYGFKLFLIGVVTLPIASVIISLALFERKGRLAYKISRLWAWAILRIGAVRLKVRGLEHLDPGRPYVFMANHQSNIDIPVLVHTLKRFQLRWMAKRELLHVPVFGWALWSGKHIILDREDRSQAVGSLRQAQERIEDGISIVIFPEGTRSPDGRLLPFKRGGFVLAVRTQTPIVPITINGSGALLPKGDWRLKKGDVEVIVSEPIPMKQYHAGNLRSLLSQVRQIIESQSWSGAGRLRESSRSAETQLPEEAFAQGLEHLWIH